MNAIQKKNTGLGLALAVGLGLAGLAATAGETRTTAASETGVTTNAVANDSATNAVSGAAAPDVAGPEGSTNEAVSNVVSTATNEALPDVTAPVPVPKPAPTYHGADMQDAFQSAGSTRFGMSGRVNKLPAKKSVKKSDGAWKRNLELGLTTASGNSDTVRGNGAASAARETDVNYLFLKAAGRYGKSDHEMDAENATGEAKFQRRLTERVYAALDGNVHHDQIADLSYRARGSLSLGRHFIWTERTVLSAEAGPGYVAQKKGGEQEGFAAGRAAQYLEFLVTDSLQIWESVEFVQDLEDSAVYFVNSEVGLETVLVGNLGLKFSIEDRYDSQPADDKESNDLLTTTALALSF